MRIVTYSGPRGSRAGVLVDDRVVDVLDALASNAKPPGQGAGLEPQSVRALLGRGPAFLDEIGAALSGIDPETVPVLDRDRVRLERPVNGSRFIGVGLNYRDHAEEQQARLPDHPILFAKFESSLIGPEDDIRHPGNSEALDFEAELGIAIGLPGRDIPLGEAASHIAGYTIINDVTARDIQLSDRQWTRGKTLDAMTPVGPAIVTADEIDDPGSLRIRLELNGETMQDSSTSELIFGVEELVSFISKDFRLEPGDIIASGTPAGVGFVRKPPVYLRRGDVVEVYIEALGTLRSRVAR